MLFFYAGHGNPTFWSTLGDGGAQGNVLIGNSAGNGYLRYYWQCSCEVFAHGPQNGTCGAAGTFEYACPGDFTPGSADSSSMRSVYDRWGPALGPDLRMACGASTSAYCHTSQPDRIWDDYNNNGFGVAESFIDGLSGSGVVPLCIALGGENWNSPLNDQTFTNAANQTGNSYYYIVYLVAPKSSSAGSPSLQAPPEEMPILKLVPADPPAAIKALKFASSGDLETTTEVGVLLAAQLAKARRDGAAPSILRQITIDRRSGALRIRGEDKLPSAATLPEQAIVPVAQQIVASLGLTEANVAETESYRNMLAKRAVRETAGKVETIPKNAVVTFRRQLEVEGRPVPVLGNGGLIKVALNNDGSLRNLAKVWRTVAGTARRARVMTPAAAGAEALKQVPNPEQYDVGKVRWGYKELAGNVGQTEMGIVYEVELAPKYPERKTDAPPAMFEIVAQH